MLKRITLIFSVLGLVMFSTQALAQTPSFPGAEGYGMYTTGGRGGAVYHVTTLEDGDQEGTFRWAVNKSGARTIVFDVSGTIFLKSELRLRNPNVTIAGQTAPGDGICVANYPFFISAKNVIIRFMRFRLGNEALKSNPTAHEGDGLGGMDSKDIMIDHCSVSWSIDECLSVYGSQNTTVQWCIVSQSLYNSGHSKGNHGYGGNWGGSGASYHHNLMAHHSSRTPRLGPRPGTQTDERMDFRNNVIYNWGGNGCYGGEGMNVNMVNNYYKAGPATLARNSGIQQRIAGIGIRTTEYCGVTKFNSDGTPADGNDWVKMWHKWGTFYVVGNQFANLKDEALAKQVNDDNWTYGIKNQINKDGNDGTWNATVDAQMRLAEPIKFTQTTTHTAAVAFERVLECAGASLSRDAHDALMVADAKNGTAKVGGKTAGNGIIDSQDENSKQYDCVEGHPGYPALKSTAAPKDTDGDGIPDDWEAANGLNPNDASDGAKAGEDGYTNLERYMNSLVQGIMEAGLAGGTVMGEVSQGGTGGDVSGGAEAVLSQPTYSESTEATTWVFDGGFSITNTANKGYSAASDNTIKFSRGTQFTINLPDGYSVTEVMIYGYTNGNGQTAYLGELGGAKYSATDYAFPARDAEVNRATHTIKLAEPVTGKLTFTPLGENQVAWVITLNPRGTVATTTEVMMSKVRLADVYNLTGRLVRKAVNMAEPNALSGLPRGIYIVGGKRVFVK